MDKLIERIVKAPTRREDRGGGRAHRRRSPSSTTSSSACDFGALDLARPRSSIRRTAKEQAQLDKEYIEKTAIANNLNQFRREKELLEQQLTEALAELPEEKKIEELLQLFQDRALKAGLKIRSIEPKAPSDGAVLRRGSRSR